jgi:hypothetical protein
MRLINFSREILNYDVRDDFHKLKSLKKHVCKYLKNSNWLLNRVFSFFSKFLFLKAQ